MSSSSSPASMNSYIKPIVGGLAAVALDKLVLMNPNMQSSLYFGGAVGAGLLAVSMFQADIPTFLPDVPSIGATGQTLSKRVAEITAGAGAAYAINRYVLKNDNSPQMMAKKIGVVIASDLAGEYMSDYFASRPLSYFS